MTSPSDHAAMNAPDPVWHGPESDRVRMEALDTLTLAYDRASGQTHLLASPLPELLELLAAGPVTATQMVARLADTFDLGDQNVAAIVEERLAELAAMGLVEPR